MPLSLGENTLLKKPASDWEPAQRQKSDQGCCLPSQVDDLDGSMLITNKMKERDMGRIEKPENKTHVFQWNSCEQASICLMVCLPTGQRLDRYELRLFNYS